MVPDEKPVIRKDKTQKRLEAEARQEISQVRRQLNERIEFLESEMEKLENEKMEIERQLAEPDFYKDQDLAADFGRRYQDLQKMIPELFNEWEMKQVELDELLLKIKK